MKVIAFDIETNGLLMAATEFHCGVAHDLETNERVDFTDGKTMYEYLLRADRLVAHNGRMFDCPVLERMVGGPCGLPALPTCLDTLLISRLLWPDKNNTPAGGHSLEKWGQYAGITKAHAGIEDWSVFTPEMLERCHTDVDIQVWLYKFLMPKCKRYGKSVQLEHSVASIITKQIQNGFTLDMDQLDSLDRTLERARAGLMDELSTIPPWVEEKELKTPEYWELDGERYRIKSEAPTEIRPFLTRGPNKVKRTEIMFNANSRDHVARLFMEKHGWKPKEFTPTDKPKIDESVLKKLDYPEAKTIAEVMLLDKRLSQTAQWRKYEREGKLHGDLITNGAISGRMTHSKPNVAQVPASHNPYGKECRSCFTPREGWTLVGADASGLELRMLAHYLSQWDNGKYADIVVNGDVHTANQQAAGLPTRDNAKTFNTIGVYKLP